jgi:hypothetical protein
MQNHDHVAFVGKCLTGNKVYSTHGISIFNFAVDWDALHFISYDYVAKFTLFDEY